MEQQLTEPVEFFKYDKLSDDVIAIGQNLILRFNVSLSKVSDDKRYHFHKEYEYPSKGILGQPTLVTIRRSFDYYLSIENMKKNEFGEKVFIRIGPSEYPILLKAIENCIKWFTDEKYKNLFAKSKNGLTLMPPIPEFTIRNLPQEKFMTFTPVVIERGIADREAGVRIFLSSDSNYVDINLNKIMGLHYIISKFDMYQAAVALINYLQRPEYGTNRVILDNPGERIIKGSSETTKNTTGITNRFVTPQGSKDNIKDLE